MTAATRRWSRRPEGSNWGDFGPDDQLGRLNLITPDVVLRAIREVRLGLSVCLSLPLNLPGGNVLNPRRFPPRLGPTLRDEQPVFNLAIGDPTTGQTDVLCDDAVLLHTQYSTQWDSFAHVGHLFDVTGSGVAEAVYYNGFRAHEDIVGPGDADARGPGAHRLGIDTFAVKAIQSRGVLLDLLSLCGTARKRVGYDTFMRAVEQAGVDILPGDILCLYTGFADQLLCMNGNPPSSICDSLCAVLDGSDERLQQWIVDSGISALCADNYSVEGIPPPDTPGERLPLHALCLFKQGIPLGELWHFGELATLLRQERRASFLLTAPPLRLPGAVGSPVTPIATL